MGKLIMKKYVVNNMNVELEYRQLLTDKSYIITKFAIIHCGVNVTQLLNRQRIRTIIRKITAILDKAAVTAEIGEKVA